MKKITFLIVLFSVFSCKAQTPVFPSYDNFNFGRINNAYYKDIYNELNPFEGTWLYVNDADTLKIVLQKKELIYMGGGVPNYYTDEIIGGYQYVNDGVEILNCLNDVNINHENVFDYNLYGSILLGKDRFPKCNECLPEEKRLVLDFIEPITRPVSGVKGRMILRKVVESGVEKLKLTFYGNNHSYGFDDEGNPTTVTHHSIPYGEYTLIKQP